MAHCCKQTWFLKLLETLGYEGFSLIFAALTVSILGSFAHCILMCGPIATMRLNLLLMPTAHVKQRIDYTYYLGKSISYLIIIHLLYFLALPLKESPQFKFILSILYLSLASYCIMLALNIRLPSWFNAKLPTLVSYNPLAKKGILSGVMLGFIPCGYLYAVLGFIALKATSYPVMLFATLAFSLGTVPGLLFISTFGKHLLRRLRSFAQLALRIIFGITGLLLIRYSLF